MPAKRSKSAKRRTQVKELKREKNLTAAEAKKVKGGLALDPSDPSGNTVYVSGASGGVWKTTNVKPGPK